MRVMVFLGQDGVGENMLFWLPKTRNADTLAQVNFPHNVRALNMQSGFWNLSLNFGHPI
jgi:hypothetical protein